MTGSTLLLAGGGTGGHVFPLLAVADALRALSPSVECVFIGTERGIETRVVPSRGYQLELMDVLPLRGGGLSAAITGGLRATRALVQARALVSRLRPRAVLSIGGYAAGPISLSAFLSRIPLALLEPNSVMGLANRLLAPLVRRAYTAFEPVERHFRADVVLRSGVPLQGGFEPSPYAAAEPRAVLVLGGSQGAVALNETVPRALARLADGITVVHQAGPAHGAAVERRYRELGLSARAQVIPFIDDMPAAIARAALVIGRSGASAVSEIAAVGRPSVLIPFPHAAGDHQRHNALALEAAGAAVCIPQERATANRLSDQVSILLRDPSRLSAMAAAAAAFGRPHAARVVAADLLALAGLASVQRLPNEAELPALEEVS
jgi:UDP-N-acetylglucosamine--N-acetylmuramyl-(pentapeptide) pyrophosphoryl-undecaprenol N-acetylglucosamine transferase